MAPIRPVEGRQAAGVESTAGREQHQQHRGGDRPAPGFTQRRASPSAADCPASRGQRGAARLLTATTMAPACLGPCRPRKVGLGGATRGDPLSIFAGLGVGRRSPALRASLS